VDATARVFGERLPGFAKALTFGFGGRIFDALAELVGELADTEHRIELELVERIHRAKGYRASTLRATSFRGQSCG
jgi:hypothetical protein